MRPAGRILIDMNHLHLPEPLRTVAEDPRVTIRRDGLPDSEGKCVVYWMQRAERGIDNHALDIAIDLGNELGLPVVVYFAAISNFPHANLRHYTFLQQGLRDVEQDLAERNVSFVVRRPPHEDHLAFFAEVKAALVVGDENPMRVPESWRKHIAQHIHVPFWTVDADVVVPSRLLEKAQYGAYTLRPRVQRLWPQFLKPYENPTARYEWKRSKSLHAEDLKLDITRGWSELDRSVLPVEEWAGGTHAAQKRLKFFVHSILKGYDKDRNHPEMDGSSRMSPYLHFGHIGPLTIALAVDKAAKEQPALKSTRDSYFNELLVWRELAINYCWFQHGVYDSDAAAENWAKQSIAEHAKDERPHLYSLAQLEAAETHDDMWNAAQRQMLDFGWMHNVMRMYWAKKILEWSPSVKVAVKRGIHLNDKYFLDGRDPNGYAGIAWAMLGKFDRPWNERPIFGKIRYMSRESTGRKFDSKGYIRQMGTGNVKQMTFLTES